MNNQIYSHQEVRARFELHHFIHFIGTPTLPSYSNTPQGITAEELLDAFKVKHPCDLTPEIVEMFLLTGGFVPAEEHQIKLYLKLDLQNFAELTSGEQTKIVKWVPGPLSVTLRKMILGYTRVSTKESKEILLETPLSIFIQRFIKYYCIDDRSKYGITLNTDTRASTKQLYSYYITVCASLNYNNTLGLKKFIEFIRALGYDVTKGYVRGASGVNFVRHLHIPHEEEDLRESIRCGMGIITTKEYRITQEQMYKTFTPIALEELQNSRFRRMLDVDNYEQTTATQTNETEKQELGMGMESFPDRGADGKNQETGCESENNADKGEIEISRTTEIHIPDNHRIKSLSKPSQNTDTEAVAISDTPERTSGENRTIESPSAAIKPAKSSNSTYQRRGPVQVLRSSTKSSNSGTEEELNDPMAGKAELLNGAPENEVQSEADITAIAEALKIPLLTMYGNDPTKMSKEDITTYLQLMHINAEVDDIYDQIIQKLS